MSVLSLPRVGRFTNKEILNLLLPLILEQFLVVMVGMADIAMVSFVGEEAISAVSVIDAINVFIIQMFMGFAAGGSVIIAQYIGAGDLKKSSDATKQTTYMAFLIGVIIGGVLFLCRDGVVGFMFGNTDKLILENAHIYFIYSLISYPLIAIYNTTSASFRAMGNGRISLYSSILMNVINISGNAVLIYGFGKGVEGAAVATLISRIIAAMLLFVLLCRRSNKVRIEKIFHYRFDGDCIKKVFKVALPTSMENGIFQFGRLILQRFVATLGTAAIAAYAVACSIASVSNAAGSAINNGMIAVVGQCMGAGEKEDAVMYTKHILKISYVFTWIISAGLILVNPYLLSVYNLGPQAHGYTNIMLYMYYIGCSLIWPLSFNLPMALKGAGDTKFTFIASLVSMWLVRIVLGYILGEFMGVVGVWIAMICDWVVRSTVFLIRFKDKDKWQNIKVI